MLRLLKQIILFPMDLLFLTVDSWIIGTRYLGRLIRRERDQRCHFCRGEDHAEPNHPVRSVLKYQNMWLVRLVSPCIREKRSGKKRIAVCSREGGYTQATPAAPVMALCLTLFWVGGTLGVMWGLSSEPEHFWSNPFTFFNPAHTVGSRDEGPDFLESGEVRHNPERAQRYFRSGRRHFDQGNFAEAQVDFKIAIQADPANADMHYYLGRSLLILGQRVRGENSIRQALRRDEEHVESLLVMAELQESRELLGEALEYAGRALELEPENLRALRLNAGLRAAAGQGEAVRGLLDRMLEQDSRSPETLAFAGRLELNVFQNPERAHDLLSQALEVNPDHVGALMAMIPLHAMEEDLEKVDETLKRVLELQPDNLQARRLEAELLMSRFGLEVGLRAYSDLRNRFAGDLGLRLRHAELLLQSGRISEGKRLAQQLTSSRVPGIERSAHWMLAQMYQQVQMLEEAANHAQRALEHAPGARNIQLFLGQTYLRNRQPADARRVLEQAVRDHPNDLAALNLLSQALLALGEVEEAIELVSSRLEENPESDALRLRLVEIRMQSDYWRESLADTRLLHEKYPDRPELANNLAFLLARAGEDLDLALSLAEPLYEQFSDNPVIMDTYAYVLAAKGRHEEAIPLLEQASSQAGDNPMIRFHLGKSLAAVGRTQDALRHLNAVLLIDPDFQQRDEVRRLLESLQGRASS